MVGVNVTGAGIAITVDDPDMLASGVGVAAVLRAAAGQVEIAATAGMIRGVNIDLRAPMIPPAGAVGGRRRGASRPS